MRRLAVRLVEGPGRTVLEAANGEQALKLLAAGGVDLLVTDIFMPEMDGIQLISECQTAYPMLPIIALSGGDRYGELSMLRAAGRLGALITLPKPFNTQELQAAVDSCLAALTD
jgi:CheY-like chemotaxis protein